MRITDRDTGSDVFPSLIGRTQLAAQYAQTAKNQEPHTSSRSVLAEDSAAISPAASLLARTMALPEVNAARVSTVQNAIASGHFPVDANKVASALIQNMLDGAWS